MHSDEQITPIDFARAYELTTQVANIHRTLSRFATVEQILADYNFVEQATQAVQAVDALHGIEIHAAVNNMHGWILENINYCHTTIRPLLYSKWP